MKRIIGKEVLILALILFLFTLGGCKYFQPDFHNFKLVIEENSAQDAVLVDGVEQKGSLEGDYEAGTILELEAVAGDRSRFKGWRFGMASDEIEQEQSELSLDLNEDKVVVAVFKAGDDRGEEEKSGEIVELANPRDITVEVGTKLDEIIFPRVLQAKLDDDSTFRVRVDWDTTAYNPEQEGTYQLEGEILSLPRDVSNPNDIQPQINLIVEEKRPSQPIPSDIIITSGAKQIEIPVSEYLRNEGYYKAVVEDQHGRAMPDEAVDWSLSIVDDGVRIESDGTLKVNSQAEAGYIEVIAQAVGDNELQAKRNVSLYDDSFNFYFRKPEWADQGPVISWYDGENNGEDNQVMEAKEQGWYHYQIETRPGSEVHYRIDFWQAGVAKHLYQDGSFTQWATVNTAQNQVWIDGKNNDLYNWGDGVHANDFWLEQEAYSRQRP